MHPDRERTLFQKVILCILLAMAVIFAALTAFNRTQTGISFEGTLLRLREASEKAVYSGKAKGEVLTLILWEEDGAKVLDFSIGNRYRTLCRVEYPGGTVTDKLGRTSERVRVLRDGEELFSGGCTYDDSLDLLYFIHEDGTPETFLDMRSYTANDPWWGYELTAGNILRLAVAPEPAARGSWELYFDTLLMAAIAAGMAAFPHALFRLRHRWYVQNPEPTDFYYAMHRLGCVVLTGMTLASFIIAATSPVPL